MYTIEFYENKNGQSELYNQLIELEKESQNSKEARIQFNQIVYCIELLKLQGTRLPNKITKHIQNDIWELRPGNNRILYFYYKDSKIVLLHMFRKKTQKTPKGEIEKAEREIKEYRLMEGDSKR